MKTNSKTGGNKNHKNTRHEHEKVTCLIATGVVIPNVESIHVNLQSFSRKGILFTL